MRRREHRPVGGAGRPRRAAGRLVVLAAALVLVNGCGAAWTYNQAMRVQERYYPMDFSPPDSAIFALPELPPVYAVVFHEDYYVSPNPPALPRAVALRPARPETVAVEIMSPDSTTVDTILVELEPPPPVRVDLTPEQERALEEQTLRDITRAGELLAMVEASGNGGVQERLEAARGLLNQAEIALDHDDFQGAANLANKARLLAENLAASGS